MPTVLAYHPAALKGQHQPQFVEKSSESDPLLAKERRKKNFL